MNLIEPGARKVCQGGPAIQSTAINVRPHRRSTRQTTRVVHIPIFGQTAEQELSQQLDQRMPDVPAAYAFR